MLIKKSPVLKLLMIYPKTDFKDNRGRYIQSFSSKDYKKILNHKFVEDDFSLNKKNVFKGFHGNLGLNSLKSGKRLNLRRTRKRDCIPNRRS